MNREMNHVKEQLDEIVALLEKGYSETEIMNRLGVSTSDWQKYKRTHPEFKKKMDGIKESRACQIYEIVWSLARGYDYEDSTTVTKKDKNGIEIISHITYKRHVPPSLDACVLLLETMNKGSVFEGTLNRSLLESNLLKAYEPAKGQPGYSYTHMVHKSNSRRDGAGGQLC